MRLGRVLPEGCEKSGLTSLDLNGFPEGFPTPIEGTGMSLATPAQRRQNFGIGVRFDQVVYLPRI